MRYRLSVSHADDDVEIRVKGVLLKAHSYEARAEHQKGPWEFEAEFGDEIQIVGWDNFGYCRSVGAITLAHLESNEIQVLSEGVDLGCQFPPIGHWPVYDPAVAFYDRTFTIGIPAHLALNQKERDRRRRCPPTGDGNVNVDGQLSLDMGGGLSYTSVDSNEAPASMGWGWQMLEYQRIFEFDQAATLFWSDGAGSFEKWRREGDRYVPAFPDNYIEAHRTESGAYELTFPDQTIYFFDTQNNHGRLMRQEDRNGNAVTYEYEPGADGRLARVSDGKGRVLVYVHRNDGQPSSIEDHRGGPPRVRSFEYRSEGPAKDRLSAVITPAGERTEFVYDSNGRLHQVRGPREGFPDGVIQLQVTYHPDGRVHTEDFHVVPGNATGLRRNTYTYELTAREVTVVSRDYTSFGSDSPAEAERTTVVSYNENFLVTKRRDPNGNLTQFEHGDSRNPFLVTKVIDPNLVSTTFEYNAQGNLTVVRDADLNETVTRYAEDLLGAATPRKHRNLPYEVERPPVTVRENGREVKKRYPPVRLQYDHKGNLDVLTDPKGATVRYERFSDGRVRAVKDRLGHVTLLSYNVTGNLESVTTPGTPWETLPLVTSFQYHPENFDHLHRVVDPGKGVQEYEYDPDDRLTLIRDPRGFAVEMKYRDGLLQTVLAPPTHGSSNQTRETRYEYDVAERLQSVLADVDRANERQMRVRYEYDGFDQLRALVRKMNGAEKKTRCRYDLLGRPTETVDPLNRVSHAEYAPYCGQYRHTSARGVTNTLFMDALCRPTELENREGSTTFVHDEWGRVVQVSQPGGTSAVYSRGTRGHSRYGDGEDVPEVRAYEYDELDRLVLVTFPDGKTIRYEHDAEGRLETLTDPHGVQTVYTYHFDNRLRSVTQDGQTFRYEYGDDGRLRYLHYPASTKILAEYRWDAAGNLEMMHYKREGVTLRKLEYLYDASGNRSHFVDTPMDLRAATTWEYRYDRLNRLKTVHRDQVLVSAYHFDESDNRSSLEKLVDGALRRYDYGYDAADQILDVRQDGLPFMKFAHDADGNMTRKEDLLSGRSDAYSWSVTGRLTSITTSQRGEADKTIKNSYDASHFRKRRLGSDGTRTDYYSGLPALAEHQAAAGSQAKTSYVLGHQLLGFTRASEKAWFVVDALGSVRELVDANGDILANYMYDEYGSVVLNKTMMPSPDAAYIGLLQYPDPLFYMNARHYAPELGRFVSRDPYRGVMDRPLTLNRYTYSHSDPINLADPSGLAPPSADEVFDWLEEHNIDPEDIEFMMSWSEAGMGIVMIGVGSGVVVIGAGGEAVSLGTASPIAIPLTIGGAALTGHGLNGLNAAMSKMRKKMGPKTSSKLGRSGRNPRLRCIMNDPKQPSHIRGWLQQELNHILRGGRGKRFIDYIRNPPGYQLAHQQGKEAYKGFDHMTSPSSLMERDLHALQTYLQNKYGWFRKGK